MADMTMAEMQQWIRLAEKRIAELEHNSLDRIFERYAQKHPEWLAKVKALANPK